MPAPPTPSPSPRFRRRALLALTLLVAAALLWQSAGRRPGANAAGPGSVTDPPPLPSSSVDAGAVPAADAGAGPDGSLALEVPLAFDTGFCPEPGEELAEPERPDLETFVRNRASIPELALLGRASEAMRAGDVTEGRRLLGELLQRSPDPAVALVLGKLLVHTAETATAVWALDRYLAAHPNDRAIDRLRARLRIQDEVTRGFERRERDGVTLLSPPGSLDAGQATGLLLSVGRSLTRAARLLDVPRRRELLVIVFLDDTDLRATTCAPLWVGGGYDGTLRLLRDARQPLGVDEEVVRHEVLHAAMARGQKAPGWFKEGVAQWFAEEEGDMHRRIWAFMARSRTFIPFESLVGPLSELRGSADAGMAYAQSLALVDLLVERKGIGVLSEAMRRLDDTPPSELLARLAAPAVLDGEALLAYLARPARVPPRSREPAPSSD